MNVPLQVRLPSVSPTDDLVLREPRALGFARTVSTWPMPVTVGLLLGSVVAVGWVARKIMEMHGGSILLNNRDQGGARATLQFQTKAKDQQ